MWGGPCWGTNLTHKHGGLLRVGAGLGLVALASACALALVFALVSALAWRRPSLRALACAFAWVLAFVFRRLSRLLPLPLLLLRPLSLYLFLFLFSQARSTSARMLQSAFPLAQVPAATRLMNDRIVE